MKRTYFINKNVFQRMFKGFLKEEIASYMLRDGISVRTFLPEILLIAAISSYYIYLKIFKAYRHNDKKQRTKPHVLCVADKWTRSNPAFGPSTNEHNLFGSLEASGLATYDRFHYDEYRRQHKRTPCDFALLRLCLESRPDLLFFAYAAGGLCPRWITLWLIRKIGLPVVAIWWDYSGSLADLALLFVDLNVVLNSRYLQETAHPEKYLMIWVPEDPKVFHNPNMKRDIGISFVGSMKSRADRYAGINALKANGIDVYQTGGQLEHRLSIDEYANRFMRSKIALDFSFSEDHLGVRIPFATGRLFEASLCGAMILGTGNPETNLWFEPMVDYVPFTNEIDLVDKAKYYLEHDAEREQIAARGYQKAKENYTAEKFWRTIFDRIIPGKFPEAG